MAEGRVNIHEEEGDTMQELRRRLCQAKDRYRTQKKLHDYMLEDGEETRHQLTELERDNKDLSRKVNELTRVVENHRERRQFTYMKELEMENKELREENERLTAELDRRKRDREEITNLRRAEQELNHTLEEIQDDLCAKDKKITENARLLARKNGDLQELYVTTHDIQQRRKQLEARLKWRQQEQRNLHKERAAETIEEEPTKPDSMFKQCATGLWKGIAAAGKVAACVALTVGVTVYIVQSSLCTMPVADLVDAAVDLVM